MLGSLALIAMRQEQRQPAQAPPLGLARRDELVNQHLGTVDEVAKLAFPDHQALGAGAGIAVLKTQHRFFRQH